MRHSFAYPSPAPFARFLLALSWALAVMLSAPPARAASEVAGFDHSTVRLMAGKAKPGRLLAGLDIRLKDGWKTYWRVPGDAGQPPVFDWSGSDNLAALKTLWPAPKRYADPEAGETIGYKRRVVFPLRVTPKDPARPVTLRLKLDYALCNEICIPAHAELALTLPPGARGTRADQELLERFAARVPTPADERLKVVRAFMRAAHNRPELVVELQGEGLDEKTEIFVEGPVLASFCHPRFMSGGDGHASYFLPVDGIAGPQDLKGAKLTLTIVSSKRSVEQTIKLP